MSRAAVPLDFQAVSRRDFVKVCTMAAAAIGLSSAAAAQMVEAVGRGLKPSAGNGRLQTANWRFA